MQRILLTTIILLVSISFTSYSQNADKLTTFILVRHAEKIIDDSKDPDLTVKGNERASRLMELLKNANIDAIYSTDYKRTVNTVNPLSELLKLKIELYDPSNKSLIDELLSNYSGKTILVSGHSNTTPQLVNTIIGEEKYVSLDDSEYGKIFIVTISSEKDTKVIELSY